MYSTESNVQNVIGKSNNVIMQEIKPSIITINLNYSLTFTFMYIYQYLVGGRVWYKNTGRNGD